jgi:hypothetical protein
MSIAKNGTDVKTTAKKSIRCVHVDHSALEIDPMTQWVTVWVYRGSDVSRYSVHSYEKSGMPGVARRTLRGINLMIASMRKNADGQK